MSYIERLEVPAVWLIISCPELTAVDMVAYREHIGGLTRAATVLEELSLKLDFTKLDADFLKVASAPVFQRLGYLLDCVLGEEIHRRRSARPDESRRYENESRAAQIGHIG